MSGNICIIPARGGSKRIPRKNIKDFLGKPIIVYAIELAKSSNLFDEIMISTDDLEIAEIAKKYGAQVPFMRSHETSNDFATTKDVLFEILDEYAKKGRLFHKLLCLYPTSVLANLRDILDGYKKLEDFDSVLPITKYSFPPQRSFKVIENQKVQYRFAEYMLSRSQDLEPWYHDAGQWYWYRLINGKLNHEDLSKGFIELDSLIVQDIDTIDDWKLAEIKYKNIKNA